MPLLSSRSREVMRAVVRKWTRRMLPALDARHPSGGLSATSHARSRMLTASSEVYFAQHRVVGAQVGPGKSSDGRAKECQEGTRKLLCGDSHHLANDTRCPARGTDAPRDHIPYCALGAAERIHRHGLCRSAHHALRYPRQPGPPAASNKVCGQCNARCEINSRPEPWQRIRLREPEINRFAWN